MTKKNYQNVKYFYISLGIREANFRKCNTSRKDAWCGTKYKEVSTAPVASYNTISITTMKNSNNISNEQLLDLRKPIKFLSNQFDDFTMEIRDLVNSVKEI